MLFDLPRGAVEPSVIHIAGHRLIKQHFARRFDYTHQALCLSGNPKPALDFGIWFPNVCDESLRDIIVRLSVFFDDDALPIDRPTRWHWDRASIPVPNCSSLSARLAKARVSFRRRGLNRHATFRAMHRDIACLHS